MCVRTGLEVLCSSSFAPLRGLRIGLLTNPSAVTQDLVSAYDIFCGATQVKLRALFSPEHGFAAAARDGEPVASSNDPRSGVPVHSLYGETLRPTPAMLSGLDALVCDIQDIGVRYYTYAWTIGYAMEAAGAAGIPVFILDRPNPLGDVVDGLLVEAGYESLVGAKPVPVQHGMTLGELMQLLNAAQPTPTQLEIIACEGYQQSMTWEATRLPFVPPSPAMPHISTVRQYAGACLLEGTNISEGRGTSLPFEICGAPFIDGVMLAEQLNALGLAGVRFRPHVFTPTASKYAGELCSGVQAHIIGAGFRPLLTWVAVLMVLRDTYPDHFQWLPPYHVGDNAHFERLAGGVALRAHIEARTPLIELAAAWDAAAGRWREQRAPYLLYPAGVRA
jgi:uncharacterized protein YbbC (DUF1343 family)